jgi:anti-sigma regulatory factor (Ser/Thr protein kinase)
MLKQTFTCDYKSLGDVRNFIAQFCEISKISDIIFGELELAVNEACTNIVSHSGLDPKKDKYHVSLEKKKDMAIIIIADKGKKYAYNRLRTVKNQQEIKEKSLPSGMGAFIIRQLMDAVIYNYFPDKTNELKLIKNL